MPKRSSRYRYSGEYYRKKQKQTESENDWQSASTSSQNDEVVAKEALYISDSDSNTVEEELPASTVDEEELYTSSDTAEVEEELPASSSTTLSNDLRDWMLKFQVHTDCGNSLLKILKQHGYPELPSDTRTLIKTPRKIEIKQMGTGSFWYNGVAKNILQVLPNITANTAIFIIVNIDGIAPFKSSADNLWPILFMLEGYPTIQPMVAGVYYGRKKPPLSDFFKDFVEELIDLSKGIVLNNYMLTVHVKIFVCDTPARSYIKGTPGFNAEDGSCIKCLTTGEYDKGGRHMSYPNINSPLRTDTSFRNKDDDSHHKEDTPLVKLPIDMVKSFIVADSLHLLHLGIMRKCLFGWREGGHNFRTTRFIIKKEIISSQLAKANYRRPKEFERKIRTLDDMKWWKGTEYRTFLLYLGPVVLKDSLKPYVYDNFMILHCATTILSAEYYKPHQDIADKLIQKYIHDYIKIYDRDAISSNVHNLAHVVDDVKNFGVLPKINAYPFENHLGYMKHLLRSGNLPLSQIAKRISELNKKNRVETIDNRKMFSGKLDVDRYKQIKLNGVTLGSNEKDCFVLLKNKDIVKISYIKKENGNVKIVGKTLKILGDFFVSPLKSSKLNIYCGNINIVV